MQTKEFCLINNSLPSNDADLSYPDHESENMTKISHPTTNQTSNEANKTDNIAENQLFNKMFNLLR